MINLNTSNITDPWGCYYEGYCELIENALKGYSINPVRVNHNIIYALLFNLRHVIELGLKDILAQIGHIYGKHDVIFQHDLNSLKQLIFKQLKAYERFDGNTWTKHWNVIENHIQFFIDNDTGSYSFRYPATKNKHPSIPNDLNIDIEIIERMFKDIRQAFIKITPIIMADDRNKLKYFEDA